MNDVDLRDIAAALEALQPGSGATVLRDGDNLRITWNSAAPIPDEATIRAAIAALPQQREQRDTEAAQLRQRIRTLAQSAVGVRVDALTAAQVRALQAIMLWQAGALDKDGNVRPLGEWV